MTLPTVYACRPIARATATRQEGQRERLKLEASRPCLDLLTFSNKTKGLAGAETQERFTYAAWRRRRAPLWVASTTFDVASFACCMNAA